MHTGTPITAPDSLETALFGPDTGQAGPIATADLVVAMVNSGAGISDLIFSPGRPPQVEVRGELTPVEAPGLWILKAEDTCRVARDIVGGNAQALLQTDEIEALSEEVPGGIATYAYVFQLAILVLLVTLAGWGLAGLGFFDLRWPTPVQPKTYRAVYFALLFLASLSLRECWNVVLGAQLLLLARRRIRQSPHSRRVREDKSKTDVTQ